MPRWKKIMVAAFGAVFIGCICLGPIGALSAIIALVALVLFVIMDHGPTKHG